MRSMNRQGERSHPRPAAGGVRHVRRPDQWAGVRNNSLLHAARLNSSGVACELAGGGASIAAPPPRRATMREKMTIHIDMICQDTNHPDKRRRHAGRAWCEVVDHRFEAKGPAPIYKLTTLLWLHGHGGEKFEVWDDITPFGKPGGLAMAGRVRNWASLETPKGAPMFRSNSKPDPAFTPEQRAVVAKAAGVVVSCDADSGETFAPTGVLSTPEAQSYPEAREGPQRANILASESAP